MSNLAQFPDPQRQLGAGDGDGTDIDARLRAVEHAVGDIKSRMGEVATKTDLSLLQKDIRIWILTGSAITLLVIIGWLVSWVIRLSTS